MPRSCSWRSPPGVGRGLTHRLQICLAALLEQPVHAAVEVLHAEAQELGMRVSGQLHPAMRPAPVTVLMPRSITCCTSGWVGWPVWPIDCERSPDPMKYTSTPGTRVWRLASLA